MSILFSLTGSVQPSAFSFFQTSLEELTRLKESNTTKLNYIEPILIQEDEGYLGTISNYYNPKDYQTNIANSKKSPINPNPGKQDNAFLNSTNEVAVIKGSIKFINNFFSPSLTDNKKHKNLYQLFIKNYIEEFGLNEIVSRYLKNIISGKILWRNKYGFNKLIDIEFKSSNNNQPEQYRFDTSILHTVDYENVLFNDLAQQNKFEDLVNKLSLAIKDNDTFAILNIQYFVELGIGANVFPSQSFLDEKPEGKGRCLAFQLINKNQKQAILHSQKIGNAIRTIDTWYEDNAQAIPVEAYGVVVTQREAFRPSGSNSFYDFFEPSKFEKFVNTYETQKPTDKHYMMSMFIKGGVFGV